MKLLLLCLCVAAASAGLAPLYMAKTRGIPNSFIIRAKDAAVLDQVEKDVLGQFESMRLATPKVSKIRDLLPILTLRIPPHFINTIRSIDGIEYVEQESMGEIFGQQANPTWGIDRIDSTDGIDYMYNYNDNVLGNGVPIYIVDTGMRTSHNEFSGRIQRLYGGEDDHGHGTHCGGTAAGTTYGIARKASIFSAKVCNAFGGCPTYLILEGLNAVLNAMHVHGLGVVSMSLGSGSSPTIDAAVQQLLDAGFVVSVAAGNSNSDACYISPARVPDAITVAASDRYDQRASFSCYGSCVDIFAPGVNIESAGVSYDSAVTTMSGTSMACPHVTGVAALYFQKNPNAKNVVQSLIADSTPSRIYDVKGSPNKLLYTGKL